MFKLSKMTDYAVVILAQMDKNAEALMSASILATETRLPEPTVSKILKMLLRNNIVTSVRGAQGGYSLSQNLADISVARVIAATQGPISMTSCVDGNESSCDLSASCSMNNKWNGVNAAMVRTLENITLKEMMGS